jgi:hypothetical protein
MATNDEEAIICPSCGSTSVVPIRYGYPSPDLWEAEEAEGVVIGGCVVTDNQPQRQCRVCEARW